MSKSANLNIAHMVQVNLPNINPVRSFLFTDTCTRWGKIYNAGDNYRCQDGSNFCLCIEGENTISTRMATSVYSICRWSIKWDPVGQRTCYILFFFKSKEHQHVFVIHGRMSFSPTEKHQLIVHFLKSTSFFLRLLNSM